MFRAEDILYEDNHLIVINKRAGDLVQPDRGGSASLEDEVKAFIKERDHKPGNVFLGVVHRIDRPVSGAVVMAKTGKALVRLNEMMRERQISKSYWALVERLPAQPAATLRHWLRRDPRTNVTRPCPGMAGAENGPARVEPSEASSPTKAGSSREARCRSAEGGNSAADRPRLAGRSAQPAAARGADAKEAVLHYKVLASGERYHLLEVDLQTGRHHQIRAQLAAIGCPIRGDLKYGAARSLRGGGISLHSRRVEFRHPVSGETVSVTAPVPAGDNLWACFEKL